MITKIEKDLKSGFSGGRVAKIEVKAANTDNLSKWRKVRLEGQGEQRLR